jgi:hypothetical protein
VPALPIVPAVPGPVVPALPIVPAVPGPVVPALPIVPAVPGPDVPPLEADPVVPPSPTADVPPVPGPGPIGSPPAQAARATAARQKETKTNDLGEVGDIVANSRITRCGSSSRYSFASSSGESINLVCPCRRCTDDARHVRAKSESHPSQPRRSQRSIPALSLSFFGKV